MTIFECLTQSQMMAKCEPRIGGTYSLKRWRKFNLKLAEVIVASVAKFEPQTAPNGGKI